MDDEESEALRVLSKRPFDRTTSEVQLLSAWLAAHCSPFFSNMQSEVVSHLCTLAGHVHLPEGQPAYTQGTIGDGMYIVISGYCSVLKHSEAAAATAAAGFGGSISSAEDDPPTHLSNSSTSSSRSGTLSHPVSRRATVELQTQQFALATGVVGTSNSTSSSGGTPAAAGGGAAASRRGTSELSFPHAIGASVAGSSRRVSGAVGQLGVVPIGGSGGSRRVTAEQVTQQRLQESAHLGWAFRGECFGEAALVNPSQRRPVSVVAGDGGVMLMVLDRACFNKLQAQAQEKQPLAAAVVQSVLAAACRPILRVVGRGRTAEDVETLSELFSGLEAFKCMPQPVRVRLAKACQGLALPPGGVVFEEDESGDAMFVVVSGTLQVRARPLQQQQGQQQSPAGDSKVQSTTPSNSACGGVSPSAAAGAAPSPGSVGSSTDGSGQRRVRATTDAVCAGGQTAAAVGSGGSPSRRTTWEGVAFTAKEQGRLQAVRAALGGERRQERSGMAKQQQQQQHRQRQGSSSHSEVERDGLYWTARFMADATTAATASDPHWGLEGGMTPLAAVFASKWRQQVRQQAVQHHADAAAADEQAAEDKAYAAMEEMLGKAAARTWKAAREAAAAAAGASAAANNTSNTGSDNKSPFTPAVSLAGGKGAEAAASAGVVATAAGTTEGATSTSLNSPAAGSVAEDGAAGDSQPETPSSSSSGGGAGDAASAAEECGHVPCTPRTAAAAAQQLLAAASAASDPAEAVKLHLAALGVRDPSDVSKTLMAELGSRAGLDGLLVALASYLEHKGLPRRLNKKSSLKITKELNKRMLAGASWQGYAGSGFNSSNSSFNQRQQQQQQGGHKAGHRGRTAGDVDEDAAAEGEGGDELQTEGTGLTSCDWQSSLDASEAASLCAGMHLQDDDDDAGEGCGVLDSIDLADAGQQQQQQQQQGLLASQPQAAVWGQSKQQVESCCSCSCHQRAAADGAVEGLTASAAAAGCSCCANLKTQPHPQAAPCALMMPHDTASADHAAVSRAGVSGQGAQGSGLIDNAALTDRFGPIIRTLTTGDSFGELALLQCSATRTATVVVAPGASTAASPVDAAPSSGSASLQGALLIKISRGAYDATVRALQVSALEELLGFLSSLPAFSSLSREVLTSLAVFIKPVATQAGQVLAVAGQPADSLVIIQTGEVKLIAQSAGAGAGSGSSSPASAAARSRRSTREQPAAAVLGRQLGKQLSGTSTAFAAGVGALSGGGSNSSSGSGVGVQLTAQQQLSGVQLAKLGPGSLLAENVLGYDADADEDPLAAVASATSRKARQAATAAAAALVHPATAVCTTPCKLLVLSGDDLRRFGRRVRAPLAQAAAARRDWLQQRIAAIQVPQHHTSMAAQHQLQYQRSSSGGGVSTAPQRGYAANGHYNSSSSSSSGSKTQGVTPQHDAKMWPGLAGLLAPGSVPAAVAAQLQGSTRGGAAASAARCQWQQQQWRQEAYGELIGGTRGNSTQQQQYTTQGVSASDVGRLKQVVPASQPPCVSELAAAARPFPAGMLTASSVAAAGNRGRDVSAGGGGSAGLKELLLPLMCGQMGGSPHWSIGPGGHLAPAGGGGQVVDNIAAASGRRGPMGRLLQVEQE